MSILGNLLGKIIGNLLGNVGGGSTNVDSLAGRNITTGAPVVDRPTITVSSGAIALTAQNITTGAPVVGAPTLNLVVSLTAQNITTGAGEIGTPYLAQTHALYPNYIVTLPPVISTPAIKQIHRFDAVDITCGDPVISTANLKQAHWLDSQSMVFGTPVITTPTLTQSVFALLSQPITTLAPIITSAVISQIHKLAGVDITTGAPVLPSLSLRQAHILDSSNFLYGAPTIGAPTIFAFFELKATNITTGAPYIQRPFASLLWNLQAVDIVTPPPVISWPIITSYTPSFTPAAIAEKVNRVLPKGFPDFRYVQVRRLTPKELLVRWCFMPTVYEMDTAIVEVFRSQSPAGPYELVGTAELGAFTWIDRDVGNVNYYYIVRVADAAGYRDSEPTILSHDADNVAEELIRKKNVFLRSRSGVNSVILSKKSWGPKCGRCWDEVRKLPTDPECPECYGTGYAGGYLNGVENRLLMQPIKVTKESNFVVGSSSAELSNYPYISIGDVVVETATNIRHKVTAIQPNAHRMHLVSQTLTLVRCDENDVVYKILVGSNENGEGDGTFRFVRAFRTTPKDVTISWSTYKEHKGFEVFSSEGYAGPWSLEGVATAYHFTCRHGSSPRYYMVRGDADSAPVYVTAPKDHIAEELLRKKQVYLRARAGVNATLYTKKHWGPKCGRCWDEVRKLPTDPDCKECFGTGYSGGYNNGVSALVLLQPNREIVINAGLPFMEGTTYAEMLGVPFVSMGDILIDDVVNLRYKITAIQKTAHKQFVVSQVLTLDLIDENSVVYTLPIMSKETPSTTSYVELNVGLPTFKDILVRRISTKQLLIKWWYVPHAHENFRVEVFRSQGQDGPWDYLATVEEGATQYCDNAVNQPWNLYGFYYKLRVADISGKGYADSEPVYCSHEPDHIAKELIRKKQVFLRSRSGISAAILAKKSWGIHCGRCWDEVRKLPTDPDCPDCFGTGYPGGYTKQFNALALLQPTNTAYAEIGPDPYVDPGDVFVDRTLNIRYKITAVQQAAHKQYVVSQILTLQRLDENDVCYKVVVSAENTPSSYDVKSQ